MSALPQPAAPDRHLIGELRFDLALPDAGSGVRDANDLAWQLREEVLPGIETALEAFAETGVNIALDRLEIDLGQMAIPIDWGVVRRVVEDQLIAALNVQGVSTDSARNGGDTETPATDEGDESREAKGKLPGADRAITRRAQALATWLDGLPDSAARLGWLARMQAREPRSLHAVLQMLDTDPDRLQRLIAPMTGTERARFAAMIGHRGAAAKGAPSVEALADLLRHYLATDARQPRVEDQASAETRIDLPDLLALLRESDPADQIGALATVPDGYLAALLTRLTLDAHDPAVLQHLALAILGGFEIETDAMVAASGVALEANTGPLPPQDTETGVQTSHSDLTVPALLLVWRADPVGFATEIAALSGTALARLWRIVAKAVVSEQSADAYGQWAGRQADPDTLYRDALAAVVSGGSAADLAIAGDMRGWRDRPDWDLKAPSGTGKRAALPEAELPERAWQAMSRDAALRMLVEWSMHPATLTAFVDGHDTASLLELLTRLRDLFFDGAAGGQPFLAQLEAEFDADPEAPELARHLSDLAHQILALQEVPNPAAFERQLRIWRDAPGALDLYLAGREPEDLTILLHLARPWTLIGGVPGDLAPDIATVRAAIDAAIAEEGQPDAPSKDAVLRRALAWQAEPSLLDVFVQSQTGLDLARWIEAMSEWAGPVPRPASDGPAEAADILARLAERVVAYADAEIMARIDDHAARSGPQVAKVARERRAVLRLIDRRLADGPRPKQRDTLAQRLERARSAAEVWELAAGWLMHSTTAPIAKGDASTGGGSSRDLAAIGRLIAGWRQAPETLDRFIALRGTDALARLIRPLVVLADEPGDMNEGPAAVRLLRDIVAVSSGKTDGESHAKDAEAPARPTADATGLTSQDAETQIPGGVATPRFASSRKGDGDGVVPPDAMPDTPVRFDIGAGVTPAQAEDGSVEETPRPDLPPSFGREDAGRPGDAPPRHAADGPPDRKAAKDNDPDATGRDIERRSRMLALWRTDPQSVLAEIADYSADDLMSLLAGVLTTGDAGDLPPLWQAVSRGAGASRDARAYLAAVLRRIADDQPIDLQALGREVDAEGPPGTSDGAATSSVETGDRVADPDVPILLPLTKLLDIPGPTRDIWIDEVFAAVLAEPGGMTQALGSARHGLIRAARLVDRLTQAQLHALADALARSLSAPDRALLRLIWQALPPAMMAPGLSRITRWQFLLLASDGAFARSGGVAGLVGQVLDWLAGRSATRGRMVHALLSGLTARGRDNDAGAVAQLVSALNQQPGSEQRREAGVVPDQVGADDGEETTTAFTQGAGLVLLSPYLPRLFERLGLTSGGGFSGEDALNRAFDLLHHVLQGGAGPIDAPRPLEKLLCGVPKVVPLRPALPLEDDEKAVVEGMLTAVVAQWSALGNTSVDGLRESFLRREGLLETEDDLVRLKVSPKPYDMLLDRLPWSYGVVKFPWMEKPLHVDWRNTDG